MRAYLLAGGIGSRLQHLITQTPKCLLPIRGRPLLAFWFDMLFIYGVDRVLINTHNFHNEIVDFVNRINLPIEVSVVHEPYLLGTAGTLRANRAFAENDNDFFVIYSDTLTNANLTALLEAHRRKKLLATLGLFHTTTPNSCGVVELDPSGIIIDFQEKPTRPLTNLAFAGVMVGSPEIFDLIPNRVPCDLGKDVFSRLKGRIAGWELNAYVRDIGTPESYAQAQIEAPTLQMMDP